MGRPGRLPAPTHIGEVGGPPAARLLAPRASLPADGAVEFAHGRLSQCNTVANPPPPFSTATMEATIEPASPHGGNRVTSPQSRPPDVPKSAFQWQPHCRRRASIL